jgi:ankyrin repeat protein
MGTDVDKDLMALVKAIVSGNTSGALKMIAAAPDLVTRPAAIRAYFFPEIRHYLYDGDTALHMAAAAFQFEVAQALIDHGANCAAKNYRGAQPLHYAADANTRNLAAQAATIACLIRAGANPNSTDKSGVAPIHRAVRTRSAAAVQALLSGGATVDLPNKSGSTPLHLAVQNTGKSGSGSPVAIEQQRQIILLLLHNGAPIERKDGSGKTVDQAAKSAWIRELLRTPRKSS